MPLPDPLYTSVDGRRSHATVVPSRRSNKSVQGWASATCIGHVKDSTMKDSLRGIQQVATFRADAVPLHLTGGRILTYQNGEARVILFSERDISDRSTAL